MTKEQVEAFKVYVEDKDPIFFKIMDLVYVFVPDDRQEDHYCLIENAGFHPGLDIVQPAEDYREKYASYLSEFKKIYKIYAVPNLAEDFASYLLEHNEHLAWKVNGDLEVFLENGKHTARLLYEDHFSEEEKEAFKTVWDHFYATLILI